MVNGNSLKTSGAPRTMRVTRIFHSTFVISPLALGAAVGDTLKATSCSE